MNSDGISELAKLLKERENTPYMGASVGNVVNPPPELKIQIDKNIILSKENLVVPAHILEDIYTLKNGDRISLIPSQDEQIYCLIGRVVELE